MLSSLLICLLLIRYGADWRKQIAHVSCPCAESSWTVPSLSLNPQPAAAVRNPLSQLEMQNCTRPKKYGDYEKYHYMQIEKCSIHHKSSSGDSILVTLSLGTLVVYNFSHAQQLIHKCTLFFIALKVNANTILLCPHC